MPWFALPQTKDKIAEGASSRRHAQTSPVKVRETHLMNNKLPPAEIVCEEWMGVWLHWTVPSDHSHLPPTVPPPDLRRPQRVLWHEKF